MHSLQKSRIAREISFTSINKSWISCRKTAAKSLCVFTAPFAISYAYVLRYFNNRNADPCFL